MVNYRIVAGAAVYGVIARTAIEKVIAIAAEEGVIAFAANMRTERKASNNMAQGQRADLIAEGAFGAGAKPCGGCGVRDREGIDRPERKHRRRRGRGGRSQIRRARSRHRSSWSGTPHPCARQQRIRLGARDHRALAEDRQALDEYYNPQRIKELLDMVGAYLRI